MQGCGGGRRVRLALFPPASSFARLCSALLCLARPVYLIWPIDRSRCRVLSEEIPIERSDLATVASEIESEGRATSTRGSGEARAAPFSHSASVSQIDLAARSAAAILLLPLPGRKRERLCRKAPMDSSRGRGRWGGRCVLVVVALCFVLAVSLCCARSWECSGSGCTGSTVVLRSDLWRRTTAPCANQVLPRRRKASAQWRLGRRRLLSTEGPGSYPPRCTSKCGSCSPCYPVHVAVPPGVPVTTEYYPEAWRCRCGNRLYMP